MYLPDIVSAYVVVIACLPWLAYVATGQHVMLLWGIGDLVMDMVVQVTKWSTFKTGKIRFRRPHGASNCDMFNQGGECNNCAGYPSGHVAHSVWFFTVAYLVTRDPFILMWGVLFSVWVSWARLEKKCHTNEQVIVGVLIGGTLAYWWYKRYLAHNSS
jgi:hypothetical protein